MSFLYIYSGRLVHACSYMYQNKIPGVFSVCMHVPRCRWFQETAVKRNWYIVLGAWGLVVLGIGEYNLRVQLPAEKFSRYRFRPVGRISRKGVRALPKAVNRGVKCRSVRAKRGKKISRLFFSYLWMSSRIAFTALHCTTAASGLLAIRPSHSQRGKEM